MLPLSSIIIMPIFCGEGVAVAAEGREVEGGEAEGGGIPKQNCLRQWEEKGSGVSLRPGELRP